MMTMITILMDCDHSLINSFISSYDHLIMIVIIMVEIMIECLNLLIVIVKELGTSMIISCHYYCHSITPRVMESQGR